MPPGSTNRAPIKRDAPFLEPSFHYLSQFPVNVPPPQVLQWDPTERDPIYRTFYIPSPENSFLPPCSLTGSLWTEILRHQSHSSIYSCMSAGVPKKEPSYNMGYRPRSPHADRRPTYNGVRSHSPRGSLTTLLSLPQCHAALDMIPSTLGWVDWCPVSQRLS